MEPSFLRTAKCRPSKGARTLTCASRRLSRLFAAGTFCERGTMDVQSIVQFSGTRGAGERHPASAKRSDKERNFIFMEPIIAQNLCHVQGASAAVPLTENCKV